MAVDRTIHRPFSGTWTVSVRELSSGKIYKTCSASGHSDYDVGIDLPQSLDLAWWTNGACTTLPTGTYVVNTEWIIRNLPLMADKYVIANSNIFKITLLKE